MLSTVLVPIIKDKTGRIDRMDNYRPIALASVISKVVEIILLNRISKLLKHLFESNQVNFFIHRIFRKRFRGVYSVNNKNKNNK